MSVSEDLVVPDQPAAGSTAFVPLGGDGWSDPQSAWLLQLQVAGDASGGTATLELYLDDRVCTIVPWITLTVGAPLGAKVGKISISEGKGPSPATTFSIPDASGLGAGQNANYTWRVPPVTFCPFDFSSWNAISKGPRIQARTANVNGETYYLSAWCYNFQVDAPRVTPMAVLAASVPS